MKSMRFVLPCFVVATAVATVGPRATAQQNTERLTVNFSDPSRPGRLRVHLFLGGITVKGANRKDVAIEARPREESARGLYFGRGRGGRGGRGSVDITKFYLGGSPDSDSTSTAGLKRLTQPGGFSVEEENNELMVSGSPMRAVDFEIQVPIRTNLQLAAVNGGDIVVDGVEGEHEVNNTNGPVTLTNIAGSVVAHSVNGAVKAVLTRVTPEKAMAFTSFNGDVDLTLPPSVKANFRLRSDMGDVFTDFDLQMRAPTPTQTGDNRRGRFRIEVNKAITGALNGGGQEFELRTFNGNVYLRKGT
jgi:hypothetical protein